MRTSFLIQNRLLKQALLLVILSTLILNPLSTALAQESQISNPSATTPGTGGNDQSLSAEQLGEQAGGAVVDWAACSAGQILASYLNGVISRWIGGALATFIPQEEVKVSETALRSKEVGIVGPLQTPLWPGWDAIAYCMVNAIINYIADATIAWIRGGFQGKPVFIDDPQQMFTDIADRELGMLLNEISDGLLCSQWEVEISLGLLTDTQPWGGENGYGQCSIQDVVDNFDGFIDGNFEEGGWKGWFELTQRPENNPHLSFLNASYEVDRRAAARGATVKLQLDWGKGFMSWTDPEDPSKTITPGSIIQSELENRLELDEDRLVLADRFDQVISELVNALVKVALNEVLGDGGNVNVTP